MSETKKRTRSINYSPAEKQLLLDLMQNFKHIIDNKRTNTRANKQKEWVWQSICNKFNSIAPNNVHRSYYSLRKYYENMKKKNRTTPVPKSTTTIKMEDINIPKPDDSELPNKTESESTNSLPQFIIPDCTLDEPNSSTSSITKPSKEVLMLENNRRLQELNLAILNVKIKMIQSERDVIKLEYELKKYREEDMFRLKSLELDFKLKQAQLNKDFSC